MKLLPIARALGWICVLVVIVLSLLPGSERPHTGASGHAEHFMAYAGTGLFFGYAAGRRALLLCALALAAMSGLLEIAQLWIPGRTGEIGGMIASSLGAWTGLAAGRWLLTPLTAAGCRRLAGRSKP